MKCDVDPKHVPKPPTPRPMPSPPPRPARPAPRPVPDAEPPKRILPKHVEPDEPWPER